MVARRAGIDVGREMVRAVVVQRRRLIWAAEARYSGAADLSEVLATLAAERPRGVVQARVALGAGIAQWRRVSMKGRLSRREMAAHVSLQPKRFFLQNGVRLVTDCGEPLSHDRNEAVLAAAPEDIVEAVLDGLRQAGLHVVAIQPAPLWIDPHAAPFGPISALSSPGQEYLTAFSAAVAQSWELSLLPERERVRASGDQARSAKRWLAAAIAAMITTPLAYVGALAHQRANAEQELARLAVPLQLALSARRDLDQTTDALAFLERTVAPPGRMTALLTGIARSLPDSAYAVSFRIDGRGLAILSGLARRAATVPAALSRIPGVTEPELQGSATREIAGGREYDRFVVAFRFDPVAH